MYSKSEKQILAILGKLHKLILEYYTSPVNEKTTGFWLKVVTKLSNITYWINEVYARDIVIDEKKDN